MLRVGGETDPTSKERFFLRKRVSSLHRPGSRGLIRFAPHLFRLLRGGLPGYEAPLAKSDWPSASSSQAGDLLSGPRFPEERVHAGASGSP